MPQTKEFRSNLIALIDAVHELKYLQFVLYSVSDILSGDSGRIHTKEDAINSALYLLSLYETELIAVMEEINSVYKCLLEVDKL